MAQMPIHLLSGRAEPYGAVLPAGASTSSRVAIPRAAYLYDNGGIPGGMLRPGAIDQEAFKAHLAAAQKEAVTAPPAPHAAPAFAGIPTLTPAQLAALGAVTEPPAGELVIDIPAPNPADPGQGDGAQPSTTPGQAGGVPGGVPGGIPGGTETGTAPLLQAAPAPETSVAAPAEAMPGATDAALPAETPSMPPAPPSAGVERGPIPGSRRGTDGVWELTRLPDKDERDLLRGQKWRVVESEESRRLFLGPDGEFGWDDFVDLINPLQHIPFVNIAYRAITGDEIHGAARLVDFAFGPLAGVSTAIDLAFRETTGESMAENAVAALFGPGDGAAGGQETGDVSVNTASGTAPHVVGAGLIRRGSHR